MRICRESLEGLQAIPHLLHRCCQVRWWFGGYRKALPPGLMMAFALERDQRLDACSRTLDVLLARVAVGQDAAGAPQRLLAHMPRNTSKSLETS
jgi:hypothetical protein